VLCSGAGESPTKALEAAGIRVVLMEGLIDEAAHAVYEGRPVRAPMRRVGCGRAAGTCQGDGTGCGA
jgi:nitrogen fixation protein NifB